MNKDGHIELANFFIEVIKLRRIERDPFDLRRDRNSLKTQASNRPVDFLQRLFAIQDRCLGEPNKLSRVFPKSSLMRRHSSNEAFHPNKQDNTETSIPPSRMSLSCKSRS